MSGHVVGNVSKKKSQVTLKKKGGHSSEALVLYIQICMVSSYEVWQVFKFTLEKTTKARRGSKGIALLFP